MEQHKKTITIGVPAHNEESNISRLLDSIIQQFTSNFILKEVLVACDGCTDHTSAIVKSYSQKYKYIKLIDDGLRKGQAGRLNDFYKLSNSDIFITFDADVILGSHNVINEIVKAFSDKNVGLVGGHGTPSNPRNFFEKIVVTRINYWYETTKNINNGDTIHNHLGCVSAMSKKLYKKMYILPDIIANDDYLFLKTKKYGFGFKFAEKAVVYYKAPNNIKDYLSQYSRFISSEGRVENYFGEFASREYSVPFIYKIKAFSRMMIKEPIFMPLVIVFQILLHLTLPHYSKNYQSGIWTTVKSSK